MGSTIPHSMLVASGADARLNVLSYLGSRGRTDSVRAVAITPKGSRAVTGGDDCTVQVWDCTAGPDIKVLHDRTGPVISVALR